MCLRVKHSEFIDKFTGIGCRNDKDISNDISRLQRVIFHAKNYDFLDLLTLGSTINPNQPSVGVDLINDA